MEYILKVIEHIALFTLYDKDARDYRKKYQKEIAEELANKKGPKDA